VASLGALIFRRDVDRALLSARWQKMDRLSRPSRSRFCTAPRDSGLACCAAAGPGRGTAPFPNAGLGAGLDGAGFGAGFGGGAGLGIGCVGVFSLMTFVPADFGGAARA